MYSHFVKPKLFSLPCGENPVMKPISLTSLSRTLLSGVFVFLALTLGTGQAMARALGIDVSRWQNTVNWTSVKGSGITFAWAQATRGNYLTNNNYVANMNNGKSAGVIMGSYHYATPATNSAATEASYFWNRAGAHILNDGKTLMPMLDIEEFNGHVGATSYSDWANQWATWVINKAASNGVSIKVVLYSSSSFMCNFDTSCSDFGAWMANYNGQDPQTGTPWSCCTSCNLWGGSTWNFWQYSSTGTVPGVTGDCDLDVFNGTFTQMTNAWKAVGMVAPVISGVAAGNVADTGATITWTTDIISDTVVNYGLTTSYGSTASNGVKVVNHSINLTGLTPSTLYHFRVKSKNAFGQVATSGDFTFTTLASGQVNDIIIDNPQATFVGTWTTATSATDKFGTDYRYKGQGTGSSYALFTPSILTPGDYNIYEWHTAGANRGSDTPHIVTYNGGSITLLVNQQINGGTWNLLGTFNLASGTAGKVKITDAVSGASAISLVDAIKFSFVPPVTPPAAPSGLAATAISQSQINLTWTDNSANEDNFIVARSATSGGPYTDIATLAANATSYSNTGLSAGTTYYYVVRAANTGGSSANSVQASATTQSVPVPNAPSGLTATAVSSSQINLSWADNSSDETGFRVEKSTDNVTFTQFVSLSANVTSTSASGLTASTIYYFRVRAYNTGGNSAYSAVASATTQAVAPPAAPSGLTATAVSPTQINLTWTDNSGNETGFIIARSTTSGGPYADLAGLVSNSTSYNDTGLTPNTTYYYVVRATGSGGNSANSAQASAATQPVSDIIIDNPSATFTGTWSTGTSSTDKYGTDYRFKAGGTGTAFVTYTPNIVVGGNYQVYAWYPQGSNRTTTAPYVIKYNGGTGNATLNQQINGGVWNLLGTFNFAAGTTGNVKVTDNYSGTSVVMADAIKFVYVP